MFDYRSIVFVVAACVSGFVFGTTQAAAYTVTDPDDIWVGENPVNGRDIIDPAGGVTITNELGNYSSASFNANPDRFVFGMDTSEYATGNGNIPGSMVLTAGVSGVDLTINMGSGVQQLTVNAGVSTSASNALYMQNFSFRNLNFDKPVDAAGFVLTNIKNGVSWEVSFYSDSDGASLLQSYVVTETTSDDKVFVGYFDDVNGIRRIDAVRTGGTSAGFIDDIAVVLPVPEPGSIGLLSIGLLLITPRRRARTI